MTTKILSGILLLFSTQPLILKAYRQDSVGSVPACSIHSTWSEQDVCLINAD